MNLYEVNTDCTVIHCFIYCVRIHDMYWICCVNTDCSSFYLGYGILHQHVLLKPAFEKLVYSKQLSIFNMPFFYKQYLHGFNSFEKPMRSLCERISSSISDGLNYLATKTAFLFIVLLWPWDIIWFHQTQWVSDLS